MDLHRLVGFWGWFFFQSRLKIKGLVCLQKRVKSTTLKHQLLAVIDSGKGKNLYFILLAKKPHPATREH